MSIFGFMPILLMISWFLTPILWAQFILAAGRRWAGLHRAWIDVDGCRWHYLHGGCGPVLVALHGLGADGDNWLRIAPNLTRRFRVIAPDLPGFGRSVGEQELNFDIDSQTQRLNQFLEALGVSPHIMIGNSMGGWIAASYAARFPGDLAALWLLAPLGVKDSRQSPMLESIASGRHSPFQVKNLTQFRERVLSPMYGQQPWFPYPMQVYYARKAQKLSKAAPSMFRQIRNDSEPLELIAKNIEIPVLLQWGVKDQAVDVSGVEAMKNALAEITIQVQEQTGHIPMLETPSSSLRFFTDFCARHDLI